MHKTELIGSGLFTALLLLPLARGPQKEPGGSPFVEAWAQPRVTRDLAEIKQDTLRVLVIADPLTWEERPGAVTGLEWELLERFAHQHEIPIKAIPAKNRDSLVVMLQSGRGDLIAAQLSANGWASTYTRHTLPYRRVAHATARARPAGTPAPQGKDTLAISSWSPFLDSLGRLVFEDSTVTCRVVDSLPDDLLMATALGRGGPLLVNDATAAMEAKRLPLVLFSPREGQSLPLVFALRKNAPLLLQALDHWLGSEQEQPARAALISAYDNGLDTRKPARSFRALAFGGDTISPFDSLFQVHADSLGWNWKLLAAVAYKESRFDTAALSHAGACGLMQMMPNTSLLMGVDPEGGLTAHIQGASRYLGRLDRIWRRSISSPAQRLKFVLASYNAGPGHVKDAQRLAKLLGLDPERWDGNVERAIVLLNRPRYFTLPIAKHAYCRGHDTYWYVRDVVRLYAWLRGKEPA